jgi:cytoskeletal protein CcmA (bactofilin family)
MEVGGSIITVEGTFAQSVELGRRGEVKGSLKAERIIIGKEAHAESIYGKEIFLRSGAHAENVYGENIFVESHCQISGEVQYTNSLNIGEHVSLAKPPRKVEALPS